MEIESKGSFLHTDELTDAVFSLRVLSELLERVDEEPHYWKWILVVFHNALQGFLVAALRDTEPLTLASGREKKAVLQRWEAFLTPGEERRKMMEEQQPLEVPRLRDFLGLYEKLKCDEMTSKFGCHEPFKASAEQDDDMERLNEIRNDFIHFRPGFKVKDSREYPAIVLNCLTVLEYLAYESGSIIWIRHTEEQTKKLIHVVKSQAELLCQKTAKGD